MPTMTLEIEFTATCAECGENLIITTKGTLYPLKDLQVEPCAHCMNNALGDGFHDGYEEGYDDAVNANDPPE